MSDFDASAALFMLVCVARCSMAGIFWLAAAHSMVNWPAYAAVVQQYRLVPRKVALLASWVLPPLQILAGFLLLIPGPAGAGLGLCLMAVFTLAVGINLARGRVDIDCGCGGAAGQVLSPGLMLRNLLLILFLGAATITKATGVIDTAMAIGIAGGTMFMVGAYYVANQLMTNQQLFGRRMA